MNSTTISASEGIRGPGRLGDPEACAGTDTRTNPRLRSALAAFGLDARAASPDASRSSSPRELASVVAESHAAFGGLYQALPNSVPGDDPSAVEYLDEVIQGVDGNSITLRIYRPVGVDGPLPCTVYIHGGGMTILDSFANVHQQWCHDLAATGMVAIAVDFRNAYTAEGANPFPAGLDDCVSAVTWIDAHRADLGLTKILLQGESGGANLVLATTLLAKRKGTLASIDGVYANVPYISGAYGWSDVRKLAELPSLVENDGYFVDCHAMDLLVATYDPNGKDAENPLAWPYFVADEELVGLPPHVITVNELDPLRDEGLAYYRALLRAGVEVEGRINLGLTHAAEFIFRQALPDLHFSSVSDIKRFADRL